MIVWRLAYRGSIPPGKPSKLCLSRPFEFLVAILTSVVAVTICAPIIVCRRAQQGRIFVVTLAMSRREAWLLRLWRHVYGYSRLRSRGLDAQACLLVTVDFCDKSRVSVGGHAEAGQRNVPGLQCDVRITFWSICCVSSHVQLRWRS